MKSTTLAVFIAIAIISGAFLIISTGPRQDTESDTTPIQNVTISDNVQTIDLRAKGGYSPRKTTAKAGMPTVLRVNTTGTYDCSAAIRIPSLSVAQMLPPNGTTEISLGTPQVGKLRGTCGMGMYNFEINFE